MISICAPYWNRQEALDGMVAQYRALYADIDLELSICDDGTPDPAVVPDGIVLTRLPAKDRPLNPCVPLNAAVAASNGDIVVLTNPEVRHDGPVLRELLAALDGDDVYVTARCQGVGYGHGGIWLAGPEVDYNSGGRELVPPGAHFHFLAAMHRTLFEKAGGFDEGYRHLLGCEDGDFLWRLHGIGARFKCIDGTVWQPRSTTSWGLPHGRGRYRQKWAKEIAAAKKRSVPTAQRGTPAPPRPVRAPAKPAARPRPAPRQVKASPVTAATSPVHDLIHAADVRCPHLALVLGGGAEVWNDARAAEALLGRPWDGLVIACNDIGAHWPSRLDHWTTLHPEKFAQWVKERRAHGYPDGYTTWARVAGRGRNVDRVIQPWNGGGSSGLLAVALAFHLGCTKIVICGMPMSRSPHFEQSKIHQRGKIWSSADSHWRAWGKNENVARMNGVVKSFGGRTLDLLGAPTREWLMGEKEAAA